MPVVGSEMGLGGKGGEWVTILGSSIALPYREVVGLTVVGGVKGSTAG
jgi:hypothetical protein